MAKQSIIARNKKRQRLEEKYRPKREELKRLRREAYVKGEIPWEIQQQLQSIPRNSHPTRIQSRCRVCGRAHAVYRKFGLCRLCLRKLSMSGYIPGLRKASW